MTEKFVVTEYEDKVLRHIDGEETDLVWGAALGAAAGFLKQAGYLKVVVGDFQLSDKGREYLANKRLASDSTE